MINNEDKIVKILAKDMVVERNTYHIYKQKFLSSKQIAKKLKRETPPYKELRLLRKKGLIKKNDKNKKLGILTNEYSLTNKGSRYYNKDLKVYLSFLKKKKGK